MQIQHAVECVRVGKTFGKKQALKNIHLCIRTGTVMGLVGPNGSGKTTLMKILTTLITPSEGRISIFDLDVCIYRRQVKPLIGYVSSEERSFFWRLTGRQNLNFFASLYPMGKKERRRKIDELLNAVGLEKSADQPFREYSTGMKQSLCIARGLIHDPPLLILDEPTRSLSPDISKKIRGLFSYLVKNKGKTILIASHNLKEIEEIADEITIIRNGEIVAQGTMSELKELAGGSNDLDHVFDFFTLSA